MENSPKILVDKMLSAFAEGNVDAIVETVSQDTVWVYHGTQVIPKSEFHGIEGVSKFFTRILNGTEKLKFEAEQFISTIWL